MLTFGMGKSFVKLVGIGGFINLLSARGFGAFADNGLKEHIMPIKKAAF